MLLKAYNRALIKDREKTILTQAASASATSIVVASTDLNPAGTSSNAWSNNDYMIVGELGSENAEVMQVAAAISSSTSMTIDREGQSGGLRYAHSIGEPVYHIDFNRAEFSRNTTDSINGVSVLTTIRIQPDDLFTRYEDTSNTTGYGFVRFENETTGTFSSYSDGVNYTASGEGSSYDPRTLWQLRKRVRDLIDEPDETKVSDDTITQALNDKQRDIAHRTFWSFYETERSFSSVADQFAYDIPITVQKIHTVRFDTQPLSFVHKTTWDLFHWDSNIEVADPWAAHIFNRQLMVYPRPSSSAQTTQLNGALTSTATSMTVDSNSGFNRGDYYRMIIDSEVIYATESTSTTFTGLLRGREGTTAATHADDATVTERDIVYSAHVEPTDLLDTQDRTAIPESDVLAYGASADLSLLLGKESLSDRLRAIYEPKVTQLENKYGLKQTSQFGRIKDISETIHGYGLEAMNPNLFPRDIGS